MRRKKNGRRQLKKKSVAKQKTTVYPKLPSFKNPRLKSAAITHPSFRNETAGNNELEDFDRLEFFGDSLLNFVICRRLYRLFPEADEGMLSRLRSILVSRKILARIAKETGLIRQIKLGKSLTNQKDFLKTKIFADCFEAFLGALYFDRTFDKAEKFILDHFEGYFDAKRLFRLDPNPKSTLQELAQKHWQKLPLYLSENIGDKVKTRVSLGEERECEALGRNRQESEIKAARLLVKHIRQELLKAKKKTYAKKSRKRS